MATVRLALDSVNLPGQWADVIDPRTMSRRQFARLQEEAAADASGRTFLAKVITEWHVFNPETNQPLPNPSAPEFDPEDAPYGAIAAVTQEVQNRFENLLPKDRNSTNGPAAS